MTRRGQDEPVFPGEPITVEDIEIQRLAATRAALDPDRQRRRADILLSASVEFLATKGDRTTDSLVRGISQIWRTSAVTAPEVEAALRQAQSIGLVVAVDDLSGEPKWKATDGSVTESKQDREWAQQVLREFEGEVVKRLDELGFELESRQRGRAAHELLHALAEGCRVSEGSRDIGTDFLRPVEFTASAVRTALQRVTPKRLSAALAELVDAVLDPDDPFANEVIHLIVVGSVLQAFVSKRDLGGQPRLDGTRLLLDTPVLVDLMDEGSSAQKMVQNLIELSKGLGAQVIVAEHTLAEWDRLWEGADRENPGMFDGKPVPEHLDRLTASRRSNPFVAEFLREKAKRADLTWRSFKIRRANVRHRLGEVGVLCRECGNDAPEDTVVVERMEKTLREISDDETLPGKRSRVAAEADAKSAAMVARWRRKYPATPCGAFFVSTEHLTGMAYQKAFSDDEVSLTARTAAWTIYAASLVADDPLQRAAVAEMVGDAMFRESFLGLATAYTLEEAALLAEMLAEHETLSLEDSRTAVQLDLMQLLDGRANAPVDERIALVGAEVIRRRSGRRDARARRMEQRASDAVAAAERSKFVALEEMSTTVEELRDSDESKQSDIDLQRDTIRRLKRGLAVVLAAIALGALIGGLVWSGELGGTSAALACLFAGAFVLDGIRFSMKLDVSWWEPLITGGVTAFWTAIGAVLGSIH